MDKPQDLSMGGCCSNPLNAKLAAARDGAAMDRLARDDAFFRGMSADRALADRALRAAAAAGSRRLAAAAANAGARATAREAYDSATRGAPDAPAVFVAWLRHRATSAAGTAGAASAVPASAKRSKVGGAVSDGQVFGAAAEGPRCATLAAAAARALLLGHARAEGMTDFASQVHPVVYAGADDPRRRNHAAIAVFVRATGAAERITRGSGYAERCGCIFCVAVSTVPADAGRTRVATGDRDPWRRRVRAAELWTSAALGLPPARVPRWFSAWLALGGWELAPADPADPGDPDEAGDPGEPAYVWDFSDVESPWEIEECAPPRPAGARLETLAWSPAPRAADFWSRTFEGG